jgi:hypothetical protein
MEIYSSWEGKDSNGHHLNMLPRFGHVTNYTRKHIITLCPLHAQNMHNNKTQIFVSGHHSSFSPKDGLDQRAEKEK